MSHNAISPEDILATGADHAEFRGIQVRKASVAAFLANIELLESSSTASEAYQQALNKLKELAPAVVAVGLHRHAQFKNSLVESIIVDAAQAFSDANS
ncbi:hypothetical protein EAS68_04730 [Legionella jordanis]|uniref:hypothetical protein n=1 Tax=Legionella jordanis TaxID=456 RepID=UPI000F00C91E|nr:hypothetical protein [Legionella jordanis]RMX21015.1 hypothetical protein EAS68_04730 [Legionella jordanis]HAT8713435.1 hypothetical protein [Legionella jordanis]